MLVEMDVQNPKADCDFYYFKPGGKWKYHGEGMFPDDKNIDSMTHKRIKDWNNGEMPGIRYDGLELVIVLIPRGNCKAQYAYPRFVRQEVTFRDI